MAIKLYMGFMGSGMLIDRLSCALVPSAQHTSRVDKSIDRVNVDPMYIAGAEVKKRDDGSVVQHGDPGRISLFG
ncbi:hypothetical protein [Hydrogenophaga sp. NFH-34]|uniref:hypothetical protein n=1 Tax=Hydrogenophaga sp. NFH-34 TaxID=2744446 RepID=UPI001F40F3D7|nr:hypothetical protein [Hydrogenophaga sp. NFH-34]